MRAPAGQQEVGANVVGLSEPQPQAVLPPLPGITPLGSAHLLTSSTSSRSGSSRRASGGATPAAAAGAEQLPGGAAAAVHPGSVLIDIAPVEDWQPPGTQAPLNPLHRLSEGSMYQEVRGQEGMAGQPPEPQAPPSSSQQQHQRQQQLGAQQLALLKQRLEEMLTSGSTLSAMVQGSFQPDVLVRPMGLCMYWRACMGGWVLASRPEHLLYMY